MKTRINLIWIPAFMLMLLSGLQVASAYYDPGAQRWLNRDPIEGEFAFNQMAQRQGTQFALASRLDGLNNLYTFNHNSPLRFIDSDGRFAIAIPAIVIGIGQAGTIAYGICIMIPSCREALKDAAKKVIEKCKPNTPPKDNCMDKLVNCLSNPSQPDRGYGAKKDCRACYDECMNDGAWPGYKCSE